MAFLGIELGSTRIKGILIDKNGKVLADGAFDWENRFEDGVWTYHMEDVWEGLAAVAEQVKHAAPAGTVVESMGVSAMMHGYLVFDKSGAQLAPFRTWRNTTTGEAAAALSSAFSFNIPQRWSASHLYQAILNGEAHVPDIAFITTLAGYVHWMLTGERCLGVGDASGMFPISGMDYDAAMLAKFEQMAAEKEIEIKLTDILPVVLDAGESAGVLTERGAALLDPTGWIAAGTALCPPEGDAGTGMVATNSIAPLTGNVSAGTSIFAMAVLEKPLAGVYAEIDIVTTPAGSPVAMVHCNNCTSDLDAWVRIFEQSSVLLGAPANRTALYAALYGAALSGDADCGGLVSCNYLSGEHTTGFEEGRPLFARMPDSSFSLANFMRCLLFSAMASLRLGMDILTQKEKVKLEKLNGHGGLFKTKEVGQKLMAGALDVPVAVMESAGEGGAWGIALLAAYMAEKQSGESLAQFLASKVFGDSAEVCLSPDERDVQGFAAYIERYEQGLGIERAAIENLR